MALLYTNYQHRTTFLVLAAVEAAFTYPGGAVKFYFTGGKTCKVDTGNNHELGRLCDAYRTSLSSPTPTPTSITLDYTDQRGCSFLIREVIVVQAFENNMVVFYMKSGSEHMVPMESRVDVDGVIDVCRQQVKHHGAAAMLGPYDSLDLVSTYAPDLTTCSDTVDLTDCPTTPGKDLDLYDGDASYEDNVGVMSVY